jgi:hypothetical protein
VEVYDFSDVVHPLFKQLLSFKGYSQKSVAATSVAAKAGNVAVALNIDGGRAPGLVLVGKANTLLNNKQPEVQVEVGYLPDMVTFTPDGKVVLVANEGEPRIGLTGEREDPEVRALFFFRLVADVVVNQAAA